MAATCISTRRMRISTGALCVIGWLLTCVQYAFCTELTAEEIARRVVENDPIRASMAARAVETRDWSSAETETLLPPLVTALHTASSPGFVSAAICHLAKQHPEQCRVAVARVIGCVSFTNLASNAIPESKAIPILIALGNLGPQAGEAAPSFQALMDAEDRFAYASVWGAGALAKVQEDSLAPIDWLAARISSSRTHAVLAALAMVGPPAQKTLPALENLLSAEFGPTRVVAADAVWRIRGVPSSEVFDVLCDAMEDEPDDFALFPLGASPPSSDHVSYAAFSLARMGSLGTPAIPRLLRMKEKADEQGRQRIDSALEGIQRSQMKDVLSEANAHRE